MALELWTSGELYTLLDDPRNDPIPSYFLDTYFTETFFSNDKEILIGELPLVDRKMAPFVLPTENTSLRRALDHWFDAHQIRPRIVAEFEDSALLKAFAQDGDVTFAAPEPIAAEIERQDYAVATALYQQLLTVAHDDDRAELFHHLARTYRKSGRSHDALALFEKLKTTSGFVGAVPAGLIGHYEVCALLASANNGPALATCAIDFHRRLIAGEWHLSKERYSYYASTARNWAETAKTSAAIVAELTTQETSKAALTTAAETLSARVCGAAPAASAFQAIATNEVLAISRCLSTPLGMNGRMLVIGQAWLARHAWPPLSAAAGGAYHVALIDRENRTFYSSHTASGDADLRGHAVTRDTTGAADGWRVRVWPRDADALAAGLTMRQRLYVLTLALVIASLLFGAYLTHRVVKRELQFAQLKSEFVSTVSHEFRSPLTAIRQLGEMLMRDRVNGIPEAGVLRADHPRE